MSKNYYEPMHTAEHILNQVMLQSYTGERSFTTHIEKKKSKVDYIFSRDLSDQELIDIEEEVNRVIDKNLPVKENYLDYDEAIEHYDLSKIPESTKQSIRIIEVGNFDACPCIGQHVNNTNEIGKFKIVSSSFNDGVLRIRFKLLHDSKEV
jgi:Ser-tRNA(Ala) deacylase AlaX